MTSKLSTLLSLGALPLASSSRFASRHRIARGSRASSSSSTKDDFDPSQDGALAPASNIPLTSTIGRRSLASLITAGAILSALKVCKANAKTETEVNILQLQPYENESERFSLLRPEPWDRVDKAGATVLFEDPNKRSNTIGVVVNPVKIPSLEDFGTVEVVAEKLIAAEKRKESTRSAILVNTASRVAKGGATLYTIEYLLDSTRGAKRILTAVTIYDRKLFILNIAYADSRDQPASPQLKESLRRVLDSFDLLA